MDRGGELGQKTSTALPKGFLTNMIRNITKDKILQSKKNGKNTIKCHGLPLSFQVTKSPWIVYNVFGAKDIKVPPLPFPI